MEEKQFNDESYNYNIKEVYIKTLEKFLRMILYYANKAKIIYNVDLTEEDGLDKDIVYFLNHLENDICLTKENLFKEIALLFNYKEEDVSISKDNFEYTINSIYNGEEKIYEFIDNNNDDDEYSLKFDFAKYLSGEKKMPKIYMCNIKTREIDLRGYNFPQLASDSMFLDEAINVSDVRFPMIVINGFYANNVRIAKNSVLPKVIFGGFLMDNIESAVSVIWPEYVEGDYSVGYLKSAKGLKLPPQIIDGDLCLGMVNDEYLILPKYVDGYVYMPDLVDVTNLELPISAKGIEFDSLEDVDGLVIPDPLTYEIKCKNFTITPENVHLYRKKSLKWVPITNK